MPRRDRRGARSVERRAAARYQQLYARARHLGYTPVDLVGMDEVALAHLVAAADPRKAPR